MKRLFLSSLLLFMLLPCMAQVKSNKAEGYDKKIIGNLTVYITATEDKQRTEWSEKMKEDLKSEFAAKDIKIDVTVYLQSDQKYIQVIQAYKNKEIDADSLNNYLNPQFLTANKNGLILMINETLIRESSGKYSDSDFMLSLMDTTIDKVVWKAKMRIIFKGNIGGTGSRVKSAINQIMKALRKDDLLQSNSTRRKA